ncbi:MAG: carbamoyltransferase HypF [Rhodocyclales bacterium]|nr:carbamoyltransferase HypF [Rhodocyclales bacterium]
MTARVVRVRGLVQGVGFRPYVWRLARELGLKGWVRNDGAGVTIAVDGEKVGEFLVRLPQELPPLARIDGVDVETSADRHSSESENPVEPIPTPALPLKGREFKAGGGSSGAAGFGSSPFKGGEDGNSQSIALRRSARACCAKHALGAGRRMGVIGQDSREPGSREPGSDHDFLILESESSQVQTAIGPDAAICPACIADLCDPASRRWRYAFTTCTHCGPRYTVSSGIPYDRARTSLAGFPLCAPCDAEYRDPADRRFHAETTCCPDCGPQLRLLAENGQEIAVDRKNGPKTAPDPLAATLGLLRAGKIVAIKGLGGFHLACDADNPAAVAELRRRKGREAKPFAVMALNAASVADIAHITPAAEALLSSIAAPIVLCAKGERDLPGIAPGLGEIGLMRPTTPLHLLLWHEAAGRPAGTDWLHQPQALRLVMTSANPGGEPLVIGNEEAQQRLAGIADAYLLHNRDIVVRCDDSLLRSTPAGSQFLRRARGYVPVPIPLYRHSHESGNPESFKHAFAGTTEFPPILALGGYLKNTICVLRGDEAFLSQHIGSLDNAATLAFLEESVAHLLAVLDVRPAAIAHDAHPDIPSTLLAQRLAAEWGVPGIAVPHHAAHLAAIAAEYGINAPLVGFALDGIGLGPDGGLWGGELLRLEGAVCTRLGHLQPLALPGGDRAAREPWRMAIAALHALGRDEPAMAAFLARRHPQHRLGPLPQMLTRGLRCPLTSSLGRVFDAAAGLLGTRDVAAYEGQAAMELEALARQHGPAQPLADGYRLRREDGLVVLDLLPLLAWLAECNSPALGAAVFHATLAEALENWLIFTVDRKNRAKTALSGGCAQNALLSELLRKRLAAQDCELLEARKAPANDGGIALGQAWWGQRVLAGG